MVLNAKKTKDMWICFKECIPEPDILKIEDMDIERVKSFKQYLGYGTRMI